MILYIFINFTIYFPSTQLTILNFLLHVSTYISHHSGMAMNLDNHLAKEYQLLARRKAVTKGNYSPPAQPNPPIEEKFEKTDIHNGRNQDYKTTTKNSTHTHTHTHAPPEHTGIAYYNYTVYIRKTVSRLGSQMRKSGL